MNASVFPPTNDAVQALDEAILTARRGQRRFWLFSVAWTLAAVIAIVLFSVRSRQYDSTWRTFQIQSRQLKEDVELLRAQLIGYRDEAAASSADVRAVLGAVTKEVAGHRAVLLALVPTSEEGRQALNPIIMEMLAQTPLANPQDPASRDDYRLGISLLSQGKNTEALAAFTRALERDPSLAVGYAGRGVARIRLEQCAEAVKDLDAAIQLDPKLAKAYADRGLARIRLRQYPEAIADLTKSLELTPNDPYALADRGNARLRLGRYDEAIDDLSRSIACRADLGHPYADRAVARFSKREYEAAAEDATLAISRRPTLGYAYGVRGCANVMLGRYREAIPDLEAAMSKGPSRDLPRYHAFLGRAYHKLREYDKASSQFDLSLKANPKCGEAYAWRAEMLEDQGESRKARKDREMAGSLGYKSDSAPRL